MHNLHIKEVWYLAKIRNCSLQVTIPKGPNSTKKQSNKQYLDSQNLLIDKGLQNSLTTSPILTCWHKNPECYFLQNYYCQVGCNNNKIQNNTKNLVILLELHIKVSYNDFKLHPFKNKLF